MLLKKEIDSSVPAMERASFCIFLVTITLLAFGLVAAASGAPPGKSLEAAASHGLHVAIGIAALLLLYRFDVDKLRLVAPYILLVVFCLLILVLIPGIGYKINNARRWLHLGNLSVQPSEIMKMVLVVYMAHFAAKRHHLITNLKTGFLPALAITVGISGVVFLEPDFGTAVYLFLVSGAILVAGGANVKHFVMSGLLGLPMAVALGWHKFGHVKDRFADLVDGGGYQVQRSLDVIGHGGMIGQGIGSNVTKLGYVPEGRNDFVAALIGEEWGWLGLLGVLLLFAALLYFGLSIIYGARNRFEALLAFGVLFAVGLQAGINLAVVAGIAPPKGIALPFISAGGSSLVMMCSGIGLVLNVARRAILAEISLQRSCHLSLEVVSWETLKNTA